MKIEEVIELSPFFTYELLLSTFEVIISSSSFSADCVTPILGSVQNTLFTDDLPMLAVEIEEAIEFFFPPSVRFMTSH